MFFVSNIRSLEAFSSPRKKRHTRSWLPASGCLHSDSEQVCLLQDAEELFFVDFPVAITVGFVNHLLQLFVGHAFAQLFGNAFQVFEADFSSLVIVEETESLEDLVLRVAVQDLVRHHLQELLVANGATAIIVHIGNHLLDLLFFGLETQGAHGHLQLLTVDLTRPISVEEIEGLLDLLFLLLGQLLLLFATRVETTKGHSVQAPKRRVTGKWRAWAS